MIVAFFVALLLSMLGQGPTPAPHGVTVSPVAPAPAPAPSGRSSSAVAAHDTAPRAPARPTVAAPADPSCAAGEEWQGEFGCVAVQLPEETIGRVTG